ncbi:PH domain-containing protein [Microbacterium sp.]|uniref:PH domain-containing protein n=1 Tax=Microbacterium sp. TaxID=51671 RepID=UPI00281275DE|nr:PH domain-containing protein [Microbacterium sp.]
MAENRREGARTYRAPSGLVVLIACVLLAAFLLGDAVVRGSWGQMLLLAPWVLLALWAVYEVAAVSAVRVDDGGVLVQNMLRRTSFGWNHVRDVDLRWQLVFSLEDGTDVACYGEPARSRPVRTRMRDDEAPKAPAGVRVLADIRERWQSATGPTGAPIRRTWDVPALAVLGVLVLWAAAAVIIANLG